MKILLNDIDIQFFKLLKNELTNNELIKSKLLKCSIINGKSFILLTVHSIHYFS